MTLTSIDQELLNGLRLFPDKNLDRLRAHLAAGLPMTGWYGWHGYDEPATEGCAVGVAFSQKEFDTSERYEQLHYFAGPTFLVWNESLGSLSGERLHRLALLVDIEYRRRHPAPNPVEGKTKVLVGVD